jgi:Putative lactococcus lactis phage r1t holin
MFTREFFLATLERALRTAAQAAIIAIVGTGVMAAQDAQINAFTVDWAAVAGFSLGGFVLSVLFSLVGGTFGQAGPSWGPETITKLPDVPLTDPDAAGIPDTHPNDPSLNGGDIYPESGS